MTPSWSEVNAAVLAVLADFGRSIRSNGQAPRASDEVFVDRLFSLRHAEALAEGRGEVRVLVGTVVTPMARDFLKRRGVAIRVVSGREAKATRARREGEWGFAIESRSGPSEAFRRLLLDTWIEVGPGSIDAAHWVDEADGRGALVLTDEASVAAWRAGRVPGIRAATVAEPEAVSRAVKHLGANLVVVEPLGKSIFLLRQLADRFRQGGAPVAPDWLANDQEPATPGGVDPMRIAEVIGRVTLSRAHPSLKGARFVIALPMPLDALTGGSERRGEEVITYDTLGASPGSIIGLSEGAEAANPLRPNKIPIDAYCACLIDQLNL